MKRLSFIILLTICQIVFAQISTVGLIPYYPFNDVTNNKIDSGQVELPNFNYSSASSDLTYLKLFLQQQTTSNDTIKYETFKTATGWGYDIYIKGNLCVHQPIIPAISGNKAFKTENDAINTCTLVIKKIKNKINPPSITISELDSLKVMY
jgi:hypothetical protein